MREVAYYRWHMASETVPGKRVNSREHMTEDEARAKDPTATPLMWSKEMRPVHERPPGHVNKLESPEAFDPYDPRWTT